MESVYSRTVLFPSSPLSLHTSLNHNIMQLSSMEHVPIVFMHHVVDKLFVNDVCVDPGIGLRFGLEIVVEILKHAEIDDELVFDLFEFVGVLDDLCDLHFAPVLLDHHVVSLSSVFLPVFKVVLCVLEVACCVPNMARIRVFDDSFFTEL